MTRDECIDFLFAKAAEERDVTREDFAAMLYGWDIGPLAVDGAVVGMVMLRFHEIHMWLEPMAALRHARRLIREYLLPNIEKHGYLTTVTPKDEKTERLLVRLGFYKTSEDADRRTYRIEKSRLH
jgi:hypothetical protein